jgi:hypothetical protein
LQNLVYGNERLECLDLVGEDGLPVVRISNVPVVPMRSGGRWAYLA